MLARGCVKVGMRAARMMMAVMLIVPVVAVMMAITIIVFIKCCTMQI